jgi:glycosyltransferase involved in cell wall biosynthesis
MNKISIVIPVLMKNSIEKLLSHLINSVLYKDAMEIAVDGGSTDGSQEK